MSYKVYVKEFSFHPFVVTKQKEEELPDLEYKEQWESFYQVTLGGGVPAMWMAKGFKNGKGKQKREIVAWYNNEKMWWGCGYTFEEAIRGALRDAWRYM
jgi:hypothetical protein